MPQHSTAQRYLERGLTWVEVLVVLAIAGVLLSAAVPSWRALHMQQAERRLLNDVRRALAFARNEAFLQAETLVLLPRIASDGWSSGMILKRKREAIDDKTAPLHVWHWHNTHVNLVWHGFLGDAVIIIAYSPAKLAMNGYFILKTPYAPSTRWVVNRFGRIRVLRKHVD